MSYRLPSRPSRGEKEEVDMWIDLRNDRMRNLLIVSMERTGANVKLPLKYRFRAWTGMSTLQWIH